MNILDHIELQQNLQAGGPGSGRHATSSFAGMHKTLVSHGYTAGKSSQNSDQSVSSYSHPNGNVAKVFEGTGPKGAVGVNVRDGAGNLLHSQGNFNSDKLGDALKEIHDPQ